jgi:hypothetical protein
LPFTLTLFRLLFRLLLLLLLLLLERRRRGSFCSLERLHSVPATPAPTLDASLLD